MSGEGRDPFMTVAVAYSQSELPILLGYLRANGIWAHPVGAGHAAVDWRLTVALGGIEVRVHREDAAEAAELLSTIERTFYRGGLFSDQRLVDVAMILLMLILGILAPPARIPAFFLDPRAACERKAD
jgi:hypothetical protein